jgi:hypothetical protein
MGAFLDHSASSAGTSATSVSSSQLTEYRNLTRARLFSVCEYRNLHGTNDSRYFNHTERGNA